MLKDATAAILAGGLGRRLGGVNKALLEVDGRTLLERQRTVLEPLFARVVVVAPEPTAFGGVGMELVADRIPGRGAPGGVHAALEAATTPWVFCVACDMPFLTAESIEVLARRRGGQNAVVPVRGGFLEPLFAFYARGCKEVFAAALRTATPSLVWLLGQVGARRVQEPELRAVDSELRCLVNVNTPADLARVREGRGDPRIPPPASTSA